MLKTLLIASDSLISTAVSSALVEGIVSAVDEILVPGVACFRGLSEKVTRAFVGVVFEDFLRGVLEEDFVEMILVKCFA